MVPLSEDLMNRSCNFAIMNDVVRKIGLLCAIALVVFTAKAQDSWPSPEVQQMDRHAQDYVAMGNYKDAIVTYKQAIILAPDKFVLYKGLGKALYLAGSYGEAVEVLNPFMDKSEADEEFYDLLGASWAAQKDAKRTKATLNKGLERYPSSGLLYYDLGHLYDLEKKPQDALDAWVVGIKKDPAYPKNYHDAALMYLNGDDVMQGLLYGEIYLNIALDTVGAEAMKKKLFAGYKTMFDDIATRSTTKLGEMDQPAKSFMDAVEKTYLSLTPVVSDGVTTENLTMVRARFLMDWADKYAGTYPYSLFAYQNYLLRNGLFDIYNEWLFGKAESVTEYNAWTQFHSGEMDIFLEKKAAHGLTPASTAVYNDAGMDGEVKHRKR